MNLPAFALRRRHTVYALGVAAVVSGLAAYVALPIQLLPDTAPPLVHVVTSYPGATAEDVADGVSDPIEEEVAALEGVHKVTSTSQEGLSVVTVEFRYDILVDLAAVDVQNALARIAGRLPSGGGPPQVIKFSTSDRPVLTVGLRADDLVAARRLGEEVLAPELQRVEGVALVDVFGGHQPEISVRVDRDRLEAHHLPLAAVAEAIRSHNASRPAGQIRSRQGRQYSFRVDGRAGSLQQIEDILITGPGNRRIRVGDVATVRAGAAEDLSRFRVNGQAAVALQIFKQEDANTVDVVLQARRALASLGSRYDQVEIIEAEEAATFTERVVDNMLGAVWQALLLAAVVMFLFLGSLRRGLVVLVSMPMSFLLTFAGMQLLQIDLNLITLTAIILSVGMVVDASVVVLENITRRHAEGGLDIDAAALEGAWEVQFAVLAGVATTLVVLVPLLFLYGFVGKIFGPLATTLMLAFVSSVFVALTLVPLLAGLVTGRKGPAERLAARLTRPWQQWMDSLCRLYTGILGRALRHRRLVLLLVAGISVAGLWILRGRGSELLPRMDSGSSFVVVETSSGSSLDETERVVHQIEQVILAEPEVVRLSSQVGYEPGMHSFAGGGAQGPTQGYLSVTLTPRTQRSSTIWEIQRRWRRELARIPNIRNLVIRESGSTAKATTASSIIVSIKGEDPLVLDLMGEEVLATLTRVEGVVSPYRGWRRDRRSIDVGVDPERAREIGLTPVSVARTMAQSLDGIGAGLYRGDLGQDTPIRVRYDRRFRQQEADAFAVRTQTAGGAMVPVGAVAQGRRQYVQGLVTRENLRPTLQVLALHGGRPLSFVLRDVETALASVTVPRGYQVGLEGESADMAESRRELFGALAMAVFGIYLLLVAQFRSWTHPVTVLMAVPLSLVGVGIALWIAGKPVSMPVMVGLILLVGIVVNNSIILIDFIQRRQSRGTARQEAILASVTVRFRPIMMTSFSTVVGMLPLALEWALGAERFSPLATAVIGGMTASTFLTLIVIPVLYDTFESWREGPWRDLLRRVPQGA